MPNDAGIFRGIAKKQAETERQRDIGIIKRGIESPHLPPDAIKRIAEEVKRFVPEAERELPASEKRR